MQPQSSTTSSPYYHQYYPTGAAADLPPFNPVPATYASAPPMTASPPDYSYSSFPQNPDYAPNHLQYSFPHLQDTSQNHHLYRQSQPPGDYIPDQRNGIPNPDPAYDPSYSLNSYPYGSSDVPYHDNSYESKQNYGGDQSIYGEGVYKYNSGRVEPSYGGKGGLSADSRGGSEVMFDDYGRLITGPGGKEQNEFGNYSPKVVKAVPKAEDSGDVKSGVQKFRVKLLSEDYSQPDMDVLCQVGLDGIRFLDPATSRLLKVYPLNTVIRWEATDSYTFAFWVENGANPEPRMITLKSNSYTISNIRDTVTAASVQFEEIRSSNTSSDVVKGTDQFSEKKKGLIDWSNLIKPMNEEKDHWVPDELVTKCKACAADFSAFNRKHHCRNCGDIFCDKCTQGRIALTADENAQRVRVCDGCMAEVTQRLSNKVMPDSHLSHEDLARKLQEEMEKNRKKGSKPEASIGRMREVVCPTCTVHLQVHVPGSGSETIECSVCQHPFLISAH